MVKGRPGFLKVSKAIEVIKMKRPITDITELDAVESARLTGLNFIHANRYDWGMMVRGDFPNTFCIRFGGAGFECGLTGTTTPNINLIVDFLRAKGYDI